MKTNEVWVSIKDYPNYQISNLGNVKSLNYRGNTKKEVVLKNQIDTKGYFFVNLCESGKCRAFRIHRLIATAFIQNTNNKPFINHINGIKSDNSIINLEWVTCKENCKHAYSIGLRFNSIEKAQKTRCIKVINTKTNEIFDSIKQAAESKGIKKETLCWNLKHNNKTDFIYA